ncbi:hypothetical protein Glove_692g46 [Diversispora epigaea]|uniref:Crinkler effector protein N-terminal domain-containing protein n=1 Tax=Diversispora epigaea TaxID=1348612 RepID=A0A397G261_9GLOM|nr:hypothetical protein Glove_692g46 [Diversispora epigaea]
MSDHITLVCLVYGDLTKKAFKVNIEKNESVYYLKTKIKEKKSNLFANVDANEIVLWKVNVPLDDDTMEVDIVLENNEEMDVQKLSFPFITIGNAFTENITVDSIHIVIEEPSDELVLEDKYIKVIEDQEVTGSIFQTYTTFRTSTMSDHITLVCLVYGDLTKKAFKVNIEKNESVYYLKTKIKEKKSNLFANVDANEIVLWKVNVPLDDDTMEVDIVLENNEEMDVQKLSFPFITIGNAFTENITVDSIHIVIEEPSDELVLEDKYIKVIEDQEVTGSIFQTYTTFPVLILIPMRIQKFSGYLLEGFKEYKSDEQEEFLQLSGGEHFLGAKSTLFIRKCYRQLLQIVFDEKIRLRIIGNPGIRKTFFAYYILYMLAQRKEIIIYNSCAMKSPIVFDKKKAFFVYKANVLDSYLINPKVWYIVDDKRPEQVNAKTILVCSPRNDHYRNFDKYLETTIRYMPVWSWEEIEKCRIGIFDHLDKVEVESLFSKWGGIPRFTLEKAQEPIQQTFLEEAIARNSNPRLFEFIGEIDHIGDSRHMLIHIHTDVPEENKEYYIYKIMRFASEYVAEKVIDQLKKNHQKFSWQKAVDRLLSNKF